MYEAKKIVAIIPARGGSKRLPGKNIKVLRGKPLIAYGIEAALQSKFINRVIVSTDSEEIAQIAKRYGAEVPFLRPFLLATDDSPTYLAIQHALTYLKEQENYKPDLAVTIQPTSPLILPKDIDLAIEKLIKSDANTCVSVCPIGEHPEIMCILENDKIKNYLGLKDLDRKGMDKTPLFRFNGAVYVTKTEVIMQKNRIVDADNAVAIIMPRERSVDIDEPVDFFIAEAFLAKNDKNQNYLIK